jgi:putative copper resistance protein D
MMPLLAVVRAVHLAALFGLVGSLGFSLLVLRASSARAGPAREMIGRCDASLVRTAWWCTLVGLGSALAWLVLYTGAAAGSGLAGGLDPEALTRVLGRTSFGRVWLVRMALLVLTGGLLLLRAWEHDARDWIALRGECLALGAVVLGALAWTGHAVTVEDLPWGLAPAVDAAHIVASGIWLGGLLALIQFLALVGRAPEADLAHAAADASRRFSTIAVTAVFTLLISGTINAWTLAGDVAGLVGTPYGRLLLFKLALLVPLLGLGALNRWWIMPRLAVRATTLDLSRISRCIHRLRWSVAAEAGVGAVVLLVVGALGVTPPARHVDPSWPFSVRLSWTLARDDPATPLWLTGGALYAAAGVAALLYIRCRRAAPRWLLGFSAASIAYGALLTLFAFPVIDAYPTTYLRPAVPYQAASIARGGTLYAKHCAVCHGASGRGDGPARWSLPRDPADLTAQHTADHTAGDLFWWVTHGIPRSGMPGVEDVMSETERWDVINFVRVLAAGEGARALASRVGPPLVAAPDFVFGIGVGPSETLRDHRGQSIVHLVLFTLPDSLARLEEIDRAWTRIGLAGARVIAVPMRDAGETYRRLGTRVANPAIAVEGSEEIVAAYARLALPSAPVRGTPPTHSEFLIDRQGWVRARWIPGQEPPWTDLVFLLAEVERLDKEAPATLPPEDHVH